MKRKTILLLLISVLFCTKYYVFYPKTSHAEISYLRVITEDTPFYQSVTDQSPLFYLPYTYYVKVLGANNGFWHVECYGNGSSVAIDGYVPDGYLFDDGLSVTSPYVVLSITTVNTAVLYADSGQNNSLQYVFKDRNMQYYGTLPTDNGVLYYVGYNNRLGYVSENDVYPFTIPNHPNELTFIQPEQPEIPTETPEIPSATAFDLRFAIIACLIFAGLVALFMVISKSKPNKVAVSFYDENDYE